MGICRTCCLEGPTGFDISKNFDACYKNKFCAGGFVEGERLCIPHYSKGNDAYHSLIRKVYEDNHINDLINILGNTEQKVKKIDDIILNLLFDNIENISDEYVKKVVNTFLTDPEKVCLTILAIYRSKLKHKDPT